MFKFVESIRTRLLGSTSVGVIAVLAFGGTVVAVTDTNFTYTTTKTGYYTIDATVLAPANDNADYARVFGSETWLVDFSGHCYFAGVNLPQGSRITQLVVWYKSSEEGGPSVFLQRTTLANGTAGSVLTSGLISDDTNTRKLAVLPIAGGSSLVSNIGFSYAFVICPELGEFHGARIAYTYTSAGD